MKLEYIKEENEYGEGIIRLYDFDKTQAQLLQSAIRENLIVHDRSLDLGTLEFIEQVNCRLILHLADEDEGILTQDGKLFFCDLTTAGYHSIISLIEPYCRKELRSYQMLYDLDTEIGFMLTPAPGSALP